MRISDWSSDVCSSYLLSDRGHTGCKWPGPDHRWNDSGRDLAERQRGRQRSRHHGRHRLWLRGTLATESERLGNPDRTHAQPPQQTALSGSDKQYAVLVGQALEHLEYLLLGRSEEHTSELQSLMRISYAVFCLT